MNYRAANISKICSLSCVWECRLGLSASPDTSRKALCKKAYLARVFAREGIPKPLRGLPSRGGGAAAAVAQGPAGRLAGGGLGSHAGAAAGGVYLGVLGLQCSQ